MVLVVTGEQTSTLDLAPSELGEALSSMRLCPPPAQQQMQLSLARLGQLTPVQAYRVGARLELFDGLKRVRAARALSWPELRVEVHALDAAGAKVRLLCCNASTGLGELEEAWLVRSLYREDRLSQPQIAVLLTRHKSWVCRRLALAESLSDELSASVRLGLVTATAAAEVARLQRCNQEAVLRVITRRGLTTRQTAQLVHTLLAAAPEHWPGLLEQAAPPPPAPRGGGARRTPGEQLVADAWAMKRLAVRLHARLLERSLTSLGAPACAVVCSELAELRSTLGALITTLDARLSVQGASGAAA
jgi:hypothetical protein